MSAPLAPQLRWQAVRRLLVVRPDNLGDVLMCTPALAALRSGLPRAHITLLTSPAAAAAAPHLTMLDAVWPQALPWVRAGLQAAAHAPAGLAERALLQRLAGSGFDAAVLFTSCTQSPLPAALLCRLAGIPLVLAHCRENPYALLSDWVPETDVVASGMRHEVQRQLALVAQVLGAQVAALGADTRLRFVLRPADRAALAARLALRLASAGLADPGAPARPLVLLHPGASAASRRWPAERFGAAAAAIVAARPQCRLVLVGGPDDRPLLQQAAARLPPGTAALVLADALPLGELGALIAQSAVLVANNSGPAHLAAALGTPVVSLYALTNPQHAPWGVPVRVLHQDVPCRWCLQSVCPELHHACLRGVTPLQAADAALALMD